MSIHKHDVRELESRNFPRNKKYALFIGQFHTGKHIYCMDGDCGAFPLSRRTLSGILTKTVGCFDDDKKVVLSAFRKKYWLMDMFAGKHESLPYSETGSCRSCDGQVKAIWRTVMEAKGVPPMVVIPAIKRAPASYNAYSRKMDKRPSEQPFGVKMFSAIERHNEIGPLFDPVFLSPWRDRAEYTREVRRILKRHGLIAGR